MPFGRAARAMGVPPNSLRYAALTGTVHLRLDGLRQQVVWTVPAPKTDPQDARVELARRYLHILGPGTSEAFARWAGIGTNEARDYLGTGGRADPRAYAGEAWILTSDEATFRATRPRCVGARLLPSGDAYYLLWGADRALLLPDAKRRAALWTTRVWPDALLVDGELAGTWRRTGRTRCSS